MSDAVAALVERWRGEAAVLRRRGAAVQAEVLETCAIDLATILTQTELETLTVSEAAKETGYSASQLRRLVRAGVLPHAEEAGVVRVRRGDLPRKLRPCDGDGPHLARAALALAEATH